MAGAQLRTVLQEFICLFVKRAFLMKKREPDGMEKWKKIKVGLSCKFFL
jgi:hypothetical protein